MDAIATQPGGWAQNQQVHPGFYGTPQGFAGGVFGQGILNMQNPQPLEPMGNSIRRILLGADIPLPQQPAGPSFPAPIPMEQASTAPWWQKYTRMSSEELRRLPVAEQMKVRQAFQEQAKAAVQ